MSDGGSRRTSRGFRTRRRSRHRSRSRSRKERVPSLRRLDGRICRRLKEGTDAVLRSLWDFSDRNPRSMELNCGNLRNMSIEALTREMDGMEGLEELLEMRSVRPFKFLGRYFSNASHHGYMKFGRYLLGGTRECLASVQEVYEKTLRELGHPVLEEEPSKTERTWTSLAGGNNGIITNRNQTRQTPAPQDAEPSFVTSHTQPKTQMSVMPDDSVSNLVPSAQTRKSAADLQGGETAHRHVVSRTENVDTNITLDKLNKLRNRPSLTVDHLEQNTGALHEANRPPSLPVQQTGQSAPLKPEHLKPLKPTLTVDRVPTRFQSPGAGLSGLSRSLQSIRTVGQSEQVTSFPARAPSTLTTHRPSFPSRSVLQQQEKLSQIRTVQHKEPEQYSSQIIRVNPDSNEEPANTRAAETVEAEQTSRGLRREDFDLQSGLDKDLNSSLYHNSISRLQKSINQIRTTGLTRKSNTTSVPTAGLNTGTTRPYPSVIDFDGHSEFFR